MKMYKNASIIASCALWLLSIVSYIKGRIKAKGIRKQEPEANIWVQERDGNGEWRRLHNEELHSLYRTPKIVRVITSSRLRWAGHVARMEKVRSAFKILTGNNIFRKA